MSSFSDSLTMCVCTHTTFCVSIYVSSYMCVPVYTQSYVHAHPCVNVVVLDIWNLVLKTFNKDCIPLNLSSIKGWSMWHGCCLGMLVFFPTLFSESKEVWRGGRVDVRRVFYLKGQLAKSVSHLHPHVALNAAKWEQYKADLKTKTDPYMIIIIYEELLIWRFVPQGEDYSTSMSDETCT